MRSILTLLAFFVVFSFTAQARTVRLVDYGTPNDGLDDSTALQTASRDVADSGGGTVIVGEGIWDLQQTINLSNLPSNITSIRITGNKGAILRLGLTEESTAFYIGNLIQVEFSGLVVLPKNSGQMYDAGYFLFSAFTNQTIIQNCNFFGLFMKYDLIRTANTDLIIEKTLFDGNAANGSQIHAVNFMGVTVRDSSFLDYANHLGTYYSKTPYNLGGWIKAEYDSMPPANGLGAKAVTISNTRFDEGALIAISVKNAPFVDITDVHVNVSSINGGGGIRLDNVKYAQIKLSEFGLSQAARPAVTAVHNTTLEAIGLRFGNGVYFANVERNTKLYMEKCIECGVPNGVITLPSETEKDAKISDSTLAVVSADKPTVTKKGSLARKGKR